MNSAPKQVTIRRKPLLTAELDSARTIQRIEVKQIDFEPGQASGVHDHPCPVVGYILKGSVNFQVEGEPPRTLHSGDAFLETPNKTVLHFDNGSDTEAMTFVAFYLLDENDRELIRMFPQSQVGQ